MSDPTQGYGFRVSGLLCAAMVNNHQLISHVLIGKLDMLYYEGIETFVAFWKIRLIRGTVKMSNEDYTVRGVDI